MKKYSELTKDLNKLKNLVENAQIQNQFEVLKTDLENLNRRADKLIEKRRR